MSAELRVVVMEADVDQRLRECDLEIALQEARADLAAGRVVRESVEDHLKRLGAMAIGLIVDQPQRCRIQRGSRRGNQGVQGELNDHSASC